MRLFLLALGAAATLFSAPQAQAAEERLTMGDIRSFIEQANFSLNSPEIEKGEAFWARASVNTTSFSTRITFYEPEQTGTDNVWYETALYPNSYYRYPYAVYSPPSRSTGWQYLNKTEHETLFADKKKTIPGYEVLLTMTSADIPPYSDSAVVDVDIKEYSLGYRPRGALPLTGKIQHAHSACKLYLKKTGLSIQIKRMDCNTNASVLL